MDPKRLMVQEYVFANYKTANCIPNFILALRYTWYTNENSTIQYLNILEPQKLEDRLVDLENIN
jgi:hypothetical protein